jgi:hypothetical protein
MSADGPQREGAEPATPPPAPAPPSPTPERRPHVYRGELTSAVSALLLLGFMFLTKWYGVAGVPDPSAARPAVSTAENAWNGLVDVRWVMLAAIVVVLGSVAVHASQRAHGTRTDTSRVVLAFGALSSVLVFYRVLIALPEPSRVIDQKLGAVLGLAGCLGIALGGMDSARERVPSPHRRRRQAATEIKDLAGG